MANDKKPSSFPKLSAADQEEVRTAVMKELKVAQAEGNSFAIAEPETYLWNGQESYAIRKLLARKDGEVVHSGKRRFARLGDLEISEFRDGKSSMIDGVTIELHSPHGSKALRVREDGSVSPPSGGMGTHCRLAMLVRSVVAEVLKDGKLDPKEASVLEEMISNSPKVSKLDESCGRTAEI